MSRLSPLLFFLLMGCLAGPNYHSPEVNIPDDWVIPNDRRISYNKANLSQWWRVFEDPMLNRLVDAALEDNLDIQEARSRILEARAQRRVTRSPLFPQIDGGFAASQNRSSKNTDNSTFFLGDADFVSNSWELGLNATWLLDIFGRTRRAIEADTANVEAQEWALRDTIVTLLGDVGRAYTQLRGSQKRLAVLENNINLSQEVVEVTQLRFDAGIASYLDVSQATRVLEQTHAEVPRVRTDLYAAIFRLSVLLGRPPTSLVDELLEPQEVPYPPPKIPVGLPSDLLLRRPDIAQAERELHQANALVGVATAERFPSFPLGGALGFQANKLTMLWQRASATWQAAAEILQPIFRGGALLANVDANKWRRQQALSRFERTVLEALEEVENSMTAYTEEEQRYESLLAARKAAQESLDLSLELYSGGLTDFLNVLDTQRALIVVEDELAVSEAVLTGNAITVYESLGGGWELECTDPKLW